jgi:hypothetical protein
VFFDCLAAGLDGCGVAVESHWTCSIHEGPHCGHLRPGLKAQGYKGSGTEANGKPFTEHLRWTDTWVKAPSGKWQVVATQYTPIKG